MGLSFCPCCRKSTNYTQIELDRFERDTYVKFFFAGGPPPPPTKLFFTSKWRPPEKQIPTELKTRVQQFKQKIKELFGKTRFASSNLSFIQQAALRTLLQRQDLIVFKTDKNLGPAIIERKRYVELVYNHLKNNTTYTRFSNKRAKAKIRLIQTNIKKFVNKFFPFDEETFSRHPDGKYLLRSITSTTFSQFYLLAKVHKPGLTTRPIVSVSGSILQGLGRWVDQQLQKVCEHLPYVFRSSFDVIQMIRQYEPLPQTATMFTMDAKSMYTNIDTDHALSVITRHLRSTVVDINVDALLEGLSIVMRNNIFQFGTTYWLQNTGTAMGTPPAPMYATLYFAIHEIATIPCFPELICYGRYIDDGFGIWVPTKSNSKNDDVRKKQFQDTISNFGILEWEFSEHKRTATFLDITIVIRDSGSLHTSLYEKSLNLYLYLPALSAHPPGVLKGLVFGMVLRILRLSSDETTALEDIRRFFDRLLQRGYTRATLIPIAVEAIQKAKSKQTTPILKETTETPLFLHVPYHPKSPNNREIQRIFETTMAKPSDEPLLPSHLNLSHAPFGNSRLIVANHRPRNLGNILARRHFEDFQNNIELIFD